MNINTMRTLDRWFGIPLTFVITILIKMVGLVTTAKPTKPSYRKTLFIELSEMGSALIADPAMSKLKKNHADIYFVIFSNNQKSLNILQTVDKANIFTINSDNLISFGLDVIRFITWSWHHKFSCVIDLELFSRATAILSAATLAPNRIGFSTLHDEGCYRGNILTHQVRYNPHVHIGYNFISLINTALGLNATAYPTQPIAAKEVKITKAIINPDAVNTVKKKISQMFADFKQQRIVLINPNASELLQQRRWPPENFIQLAKQLLDNYPDILIIITGAPSEKPAAENMCLTIDNPRCLNSAGVFRFEELVPLYSISTLMLTNDSGPAHFASVTNLPVIVLFGPETPDLYLPLSSTAKSIYLGLPCSPCVSAYNHRKTSCIARPCITGISPEMVLKPLNKILA